MGVCHRGPKFPRISTGNEHDEFSYFLLLNFVKLVDNQTNTFTYLLADQVTRDAILIDPVYEKVERDLKLIDQLKLNLLFVGR